MDAMTSPRSRSLALTVAATTAAFVLTGCGEDDPTNTANDPVGSDSSSEPTDTPSTPDPTSSETGGEPGKVTVPIYFVGTGPRGPVLFREFRQVESDNPMEEALALLAAGDSLDRDYRSPFPGGASFGDVTHDEAIQVELADDSVTARPPGMTAAEAKVGLQALVYTLQGIVQKRVPVSVSYDGQPTDVLGIDTAAGVKAADPLEVLNLVSVTTPEEGSSENGTFTASGVASSFEATVPWEIRQGDQVVKEGFATAEGWIDKLYPWETEVDVSDLAPGDYTFVALTDDPSGGEGFGPSEDTKTITVE
jgi:spore germination protein GerM